MLSLSSSAFLRFSFAFLSFSLSFIETLWRTTLSTDPLSPGTLFLLLSHTSVSGQLVNESLGLKGVLPGNLIRWSPSAAHDVSETLARDLEIYHGASVCRNVMRKMIHINIYIYTIVAKGICNDVFFYQVLLSTFLFFFNFHNVNLPSAHWFYCPINQFLNFCWYESLHRVRRTKGTTTNVQF